jgi:hypothetical protein
LVRRPSHPRLVLFVDEDAELGKEGDDLVLSDRFGSKQWIRFQVAGRSVIGVAELLDLVPQPVGPIAGDTGLSENFELPGFSEARFGLDGSPEVGATLGQFDRRFGRGAGADNDERDRLIWYILKVFGHNFGNLYQKIMFCDLLCRKLQWRRAR